MCGQLDRISQELIEHHSQIVAKFVSIVGDFVDASATKLKLVDWDRSQNTSALNGKLFLATIVNSIILHVVYYYDSYL